jgi:hypothetical protein
MVQVMTKHVMEKHPDTAKAMEKMHNEDPKKWGRETKPKWEAAPEALLISEPPPACYRKNGIRSALPLI